MSTALRSGWERRESAINRLTMLPAAPWMRPFASLARSLRRPCDVLLATVNVLIPRESWGLCRPDDLALFFYPGGLSVAQDTGLYWTVRYHR